MGPGAKETTADRGGRAPVSCCIITLNEEENIGDCLASVSWADEIVVVDSHSTDATRRIAGEYGARVIEHDFAGHVEQKSYAVAQATHPWVLCLDADERVTPELRASILAALAAPGDHAGFAMPRRTYYLGRYIRHGGWYPDRKVRLFRKDRGHWSGRNPHDRVALAGSAGRLQGDLLHFTYRDISDHLATIEAFSRIASQEMAAAGRKARAVDLLFRGPSKFLKMYLLKLGFLDGTAGLIVAVLSSYYVFLKYARLWELNRGR